MATVKFNDYLNNKMGSYANVVFNTNNPGE